MKNIDLKTPLANITVEQFLQLQSVKSNPQKLVYGIKGLAKLLGVCRSKASEIKSTGILDDAIYQNKGIIIIDVDHALKLFGNKLQ